MTAQVWVTLIVGVVGFTGVIVGLVQRTLADKRAEWWRRATWAVDHTLSDNTDAQVVGFDVLTKLSESKLITATEANIFADYGREAIGEGGRDNSADERRDNGRAVPDTGSESQEGHPDDDGTDQD